VEGQKRETVAFNAQGRGWIRGQDDQHAQVRRLVNARPGGLEKLDAD
jgi:hypothetical protein